MKDLMYALEKKGMSHVASYITLSSFQSIADLGENAKVIMESQKARGIETEGNVFKRMKAYIPVMGPLVLNAITSTEEKTIAMDARAFSAKVEHSFLCDLKPVPVWEKLLVAIFDAAFLALVVWRILLWVL
jgi:energy-coupling factor transporter transmembrane protein EcfT